jgi:tetratricopeptide (TPR) repeat protein
MTLAYTFRAKAYLDQGYVEKASKELAKALSADCSSVIRGKVGMVAGDIAMKERNYPKAIQSYKEAIAAIQSVGVGYEGSSLYYRLGGAYLAEGDIVQADAELKQMLTIYSQVTTDRVVYAEYGLARVAEQKGEIGQARTLAHQAHEQLSEMDRDHPLLREIEEFLDGLSSLS